MFPTLKNMQSYHLSMRGVSSVAGSLAVLTRACQICKLQCTSNFPPRVPLREIFHCRRRRRRYRRFRTSTCENAQAYQDYRPRFTRSTRPGPRREYSLAHLPSPTSNFFKHWARDCPEAIQENRVEFVDLDFFVQIPAEGKEIYYVSLRPLYLISSLMADKSCAAIAP